MFINGMQVVCIDGGFTPSIVQFFTALPEEGKTYEVRGMAPGISPDLNEGELAVYLVGLQNPCSDKAPHRERGFRCERFRPLEELTEAEILALNKHIPVEWKEAVPA